MKNYIVNIPKRQIHRRKHLTGRCNVKPYRHRRVCWLTAMWLIWFRGYDGCGHCWEKQHKK